MKYHSIEEEGEEEAIRFENEKRDHIFGKSYGGIVV